MIIKIAIGIFVVIGLTLIALGKYQGSHDTNPDNEASAFVYIAGIVSLVIAGALTAGYALYRLFTS